MQIYRLDIYERYSREFDSHEQRQMVVPLAKVRTISGSQTGRIYHAKNCQIQQEDHDNDDQLFTLHHLFDSENEQRRSGAVCPRVARFWLAMGHWCEGWCPIRVRADSECGASQAEEVDLTATHLPANMVILSSSDGLCKHLRKCRFCQFIASTMVHPTKK